MVEEAMVAEARAQNFVLEDEKGLRPQMGYWDLAFGYINAKKKVFEMPWQKYLVL